MDPTTSRHLKSLARHLAHLHQDGPGGELDPIWIHLSLALGGLGLGDLGARRAAEPDSLDVVLARLGVEHGTAATDEFHLWFTFQVLVDAGQRLLIDATAVQRVASELRSALGPLGLDAPLAALDPLYARVDGPTLRSVLAAFEEEVDRATGLVPELRRGLVPRLELDYPRAYRIAEHLGQLAADHLHAGHPSARARVALELEPALRRLGALAVLPDALSQRLGAPEELEHEALWGWVRAYLAQWVGGRAEHVFDAARCAAILLGRDRDGLLLRKAAGGLAAASRALGEGELAEELEDALAALVEADPGPSPGPERSLDPLARAVGRVLGWMDRVVPREGLEALDAARVTLLAHRLEPLAVGASVGRVERFLDQFPGELRWVGEGLVDALEVVSARQLSRSVSFLLEGFGLHSLARSARCWIPGLRSRAAFLDPDDLGLTTRPLWQATEGAGAAVLVCPLDLCLTGHTVADWVLGLDDAQHASLVDRELVLVFAMASIVGLERVRVALEARGLPHRLIAGQEFAHLNSQGLRELDEGTLEDEHGALTSPETQLSRSLFSAHAPWWVDHDWRVARDLCREIGSAVLARPAARLGWSDDRRRAEALGARNLQGTLLLGHRTPASTLPLLWAEGTFRGRRWVPLVPRPPAEREGP